MDNHLISNDYRLVNGTRVVNWGRYSEGVFFAKDGFYDLDGKKVIDISEYTNQIMNQPYFDDGKCEIIVTNPDGVKFSGVIEKTGKFLKELTPVD